MSDFKFLEWLKKGDGESDVYWVIKELEKEEMYEYCDKALDYLIMLMIRRLLTGEK